MTSPRLPLVKAQRSFLSGIRLSREQHGPNVKVTAPPIKNGSSELSISIIFHKLVAFKILTVEIGVRPEIFIIGRL
jgi:hypothetical protein